MMTSMLMEHILITDILQLNMTYIERIDHNIQLLKYACGQILLRLFREGNLRYLVKNNIRRMIKIAWKTYRRGTQLRSEENCN